MKAQVHPKVREALRDLLRKYQACGVDVFLFGSVAETWPEARRGADFDIGFDLSKVAGRGKELGRELARDVSRLPTVRPVDLVDFSAVSETFRRHAMEYARREL